MAACVKLDATYESLARHLNACVEDIAVDFYCHDTRAGWQNTFIVLMDGDAVGFTDGRVRASHNETEEHDQRNTNT